MFKRVSCFLLILILPLLLFACNSTQVQIKKSEVPVYWYLTDGGKTLHLSGTKPDHPNYIKGHDDFFVQKRNGKKYGYRCIVEDGRTYLWYEGNENNKKTASDFFGTPIYEATKIIIDNEFSPTDINFSFMNLVTDIENLNWINTEKNDNYDVNV